MSSNKKYWKSVEELNTDSSIVKTLTQKEFVEEIPTDEFLGDKSSLGTSSTTRRDFLKYVGFSTAAASLAACEGPVIKSIPYVVQPEEIIPGVANYYATTIADGFDFASVLVKTREGRPIKIDNNNLAASQGGVNARVHASILGLYDNLRVKGPQRGGQDISWDTFDSETNQKLTDVMNSGKEIVLLTQTFASPSTSKVISTFKEKYGNVRHVVYDAVSESSALDAYQAKYGERAMANYDLAKATVIVSVGADFLGDWQGGGYEAGYALGRIPTDGKMSRHIQIESIMSLAGANADKRIPATPSQQKQVLAKLYSYITGQSVLITGINDVNAQTVALEINAALGSKAFDATTPIKIRQGSDKEVMTLVADMNAGKVGAIIMNGVNPTYTLPNAKEFSEGLKKTEVSIAFTLKADETASEVEYIAAVPHYLESWGDVELKKGHFGLMQPTIRPLFDTRQFQEALLKWSGSDLSYYDFIKENWSAGVLGDASFNQALHDGVFVATGLTTILESGPTSVTEGDAAAQTMSGSSGGAAARTLASAASSKGMELQLYTKIGMGDGQQANNPWLQEFPDPITRTTWDNYIAISSVDAKNLSIKNWHVANGGLNGSLVELTVNGQTLTLPAIIQPGQAVGALGVSLGFGRTKGLKEEMQTGKNAYQFYKDFNNAQTDVSVKVVAGEHEFACVQLHNTLMGRGDIIKETTLEIFNTKDKKYWNNLPQVSLNHVETPSTEVNLWDDFDRSIGHHFNLSIDLNAFTGDIEKKEAANGLLGETGIKNTLHEMEIAAENPQVAFMPMMCQHCNHAPCETVCPVAATSHGRQGQNHMAYNRCVGTRYCANNCPYKVRRFNWFRYNLNDEFDYNMNDDLGRMVLNPDVVVRSRGVMEKCSLCIQKTQKTILDAKRDGREIKDGEFQTACSAACGTGAMVFGDINDKESKVAKLKEDKRMYHALEYIGTQPNVQYHTIVRNTTEA